MIHTVRGFDVINKTEVDIILEFSCFLYDPVNVGNLISGPFCYSKCSLDIWKFMICIMLKLNMQDFKHGLTSMDCWSVTQLCLTLCDPMDYSTQGSLSFTISRSLLKLISIESMSSNHLILCCPLLSMSSVFPSIRVFSITVGLFQWVSSLRQVA